MTFSPLEAVTIRLILYDLTRKSRKIIDSFIKRHRIWDMLQLKPVRFNADAKLLFWSDLHIRHNRDFILAPRGFQKVEHQDDTLPQRLRERCDAETTLFLLGDSIFGMGALDYWLKFLNSFAAKEVYIMPGNHFAGLQDLINKYGEEFQLGEKLIKIVPNYFEIQVGEQLIVMSHYPMASWNGINKGSFHIHGHTHGNLINTEIGKVLYRKRVIDVGIECCAHPITFKEVCEQIGCGEVPNVNHL